MKQITVRYSVIVILAVGLVFLISAAGLASTGSSSAVVQTLATPTPEQPEATPTIDRLAAPPTVENPTQPDNGAQLFWLHCQPCHGDRGQGLTDEWRAQYPPEDQNCWNSRCHGNTPYENGFTLPESVPAVIGDDSLERFESVGQLLTFIQAAMPFQDPGALEDEEYLAIVAFLARENGVWDGSSLDVESAHLIALGSPSSGDSGDEQIATRVDHNGEQPPHQPQQDHSPEEDSLPSQGSKSVGNGIIWAIVLILITLLFLMGGFWLWHRQKQ